MSEENNLNIAEVTVECKHSRYAPVATGRCLDTEHPHLCAFTMFEVYVTLYREILNKGLSVEYTNLSTRETLTTDHCTIDREGMIRIIGADGTPGPILYLEESSLPEGYADEVLSEEDARDFGHCLLSREQLDIVVSTIESVDDYIEGTLINKVEELTEKSDYALDGIKLVVRRPEFRSQHDQIHVGIVVSQREQRIDVLRMVNLTGEAFAITNHHILEWDFI